MKLESLKNGKFGKTTLNPETMKMVNGGGQQNTNLATSGGSDYWNYYCSGPKGEQYDKDLHGKDGILIKSQMSDTIFEGSLDSWYNYDGTVG